MASDCGFDERDGERRARAFAEAQAEIEQRNLAEPLEDLRMGALGGQVPSRAVIERGGIERVEDSRGRRRDIAVEYDGHALQAGGENGPGDRRDLAPAEPAQDFERSPR